MTSSSSPSGRRPRICLVSPSHPASNPRLVKAATALLHAGYDLRVVAGRYYPLLDPLDRPILAAHPKCWRIVDSCSGLGPLAVRLRRQLVRRALGRGLPITPARAALAHHAAVPRLARAARAEAADLYVGHTLAGLAAAGMAAQTRRALLGFDAEDFHPAETAFVEQDPRESRIVATIESHWLPRCAHLTAASPGIAAAYQETYGIPRPEVVLNVFPLDERPPLAPREPRPGEPARFYWFSQTLGPGRGLELLVPVLARLSRPVSLHLRGHPVSDFPAHLQRLAREAGYTGTIECLPLAAPEAMSRLAAEYDLGLSLEQAPPRNRDLCLTNKLFTYLLAGLPVAMTPTTAQRGIAAELGAAALLLELSQPAAAAARLDAFLGDAVRRREARERAIALATTRFNWDAEQPRLVAAIRRVLDSR